MALDGIICLMLVAATLGTFLSGSKRIPIPMVVGEIVAGVIIGKSGFNWVPTNDEVIVFASSLGFALLMFLVGTSLPLRDPKFKKALKKGGIATAIAYAIATPVGFGISCLTGFHKWPVLVLLVACSSTSVVLRIVDERKLHGSPLIATTTWIPIADMSTLILLPLAVAAAQVGTAVLGAVIVMAGVAGGYLALKQFYASRAGTHLRKLSKKRGWTLDLRLSLILLLALLAISAHFGISGIVAGFGTGVVAVLVGMPDRFFNQLKAIAEGFFVPIFFVDLGAKIDVRSLFHSTSYIELALLITVGAVVVHIITGKLIRLPISTSLMATASSGLPAAVVSTGLTAHFLDAGQAAAIIAAALLSLVVCTIGTQLYARSDYNKKPEEPIHLPAGADGQN